jgi:hypothetical protein
VTINDTTGNHHRKAWAWFVALTGARAGRLLNAGEPYAWRSAAGRSWLENLEELISSAASNRN